MPEIVRFYSGEDAILPNVETYRCREPDALAYVLDRLPELVVKLVDGSGGYGMLVGPTATAAEIEAFRAHIIADRKSVVSGTIVSVRVELGGGGSSRKTNKKNK